MRNKILKFQTRFIHHPVAKIALRECTVLLKVKLAKVMHVYHVQKEDLVLRLAQTILICAINAPLERKVHL